MRSLAQRASLVVGLLMASAGTTFAGDAWELWVRKDYDAGMESLWRVVAAFNTRQDCTTAMQWRFKEVSGGQPMSTRDAHRGSFFFVATDGRAATAAKCIPDTWDPRGPKGK
jgi:hypothetical protein